MSETLYPLLNLAVTLTATVLVCRWGMRTLFWNGTSSRQMLRERACANGWVAEGRLVDRNMTHRDATQARADGNIGQFHTTVSVTYAYRVDGRNYTVSGYVRPNAYGCWPIEDRIDVYYDARNPRRCVMSSENLEQQRQKRGMLLAMALTVLTLAVTPHVINLLTGLSV